MAEIKAMPPVIEDYIPQGRRNRPGTTIRPRFITIHNTDNPGKGADARAHGKFLRTKGYYDHNGKRHWVSWHLTVDDETIVKHLPFNEIGWHAGRGNSQSLGIEICMFEGIDQDRANKRAAALVAALLNDLKLTVKDVVPHKHWTGKICPSLLLKGNGWNDFLKLVEQASTVATSETGSILLSNEELARMQQPDQPSAEDDEADLDHAAMVYEMDRVEDDERLATASEPIGIETFRTIIDKVLQPQREGEPKPRLFPDGLDYIELSYTPPTQFKFVLSGPRSRPGSGGLVGDPTGESGGRHELLTASGGIPEYLFPDGDEVPEEPGLEAFALPPVTSLLELPTAGLYGYGDADRRYGIERTVRALKAIGSSFSSAHGSLRIGIGDISRRGGGPLGGHKSHRLGVDIDIRPMRKDREEKVTRHQDASYSRELTQALVDAIYANGVFPVRLIFFNDPRVRGVQHYKNHDNHLHVRFHPDAA